MRLCRKPVENPPYQYVDPSEGEGALRDALLAGGVVRVAGEYEITEPLVIAENTHLLCGPLTTFRAVAVMDTLLTMEGRSYPNQHLVVRGLTIDGNGLATTGARFYKASMPYTTAIDGLYVRNTTGDGIVFQACQGGSFRALRARACGGAGVVIDGCNGAHFHTLSAVGNVGTGVVVRSFVEDGTTYTGGLAGIFGLHCEANQGHGLHIVAQSQVPVWGGWLERNVRDGVRIEDRCALVSGLGITGVGTGDNYAVHLLGTAAGVTVRDCWFQRSPNSTQDYACVTVEPGAVGLNLTPNYYRFTGAEIEPVFKS